MVACRTFSTEVALANAGSRATIGRYTVLAKLGEGGMADIFLAELRGSKGFAKRVVLKVLKHDLIDDDEQQTMFADEARLGSKLEHPHIPGVLELGEVNGLPFMVQEYVEGPSLEVVHRRTRQTNTIHHATMCRIVADVARALHHAHYGDWGGTPLGVVHRDVSMTNILVSVTGKSKLIDFGVARFEDRETKTEANVLKGKMRYLAPETLRRGDVSHQTDLFALGVVLYTVTTGRAPWRNRSDLSKRMSGRFTKPREIDPDFPEDLEAIIVRCMAPKPRDRTKTGNELADELDAWCAENGGILTDADVAACLDAWFPEGGQIWLPDAGGELDTDSFRHSSVDAETTAVEATPPPRGVAGAWMVAFSGIVGILALLALIAVGILITTWPEPKDPEVVVEVVDPLQKQEEAFVLVLEAAEAALAEEDFPQVGRKLRTLEGLTAADPDVLARRQVVSDAYDVQMALDALEPLFDSDPGQALQDAQALLRTYPDSEAVQAAVERAEAAVEAARKAAAPRPKPKPEAAPAPQPGVPSMLSVTGSPDGAEVLVDGRVVGTLPAQVVVDPGRHDVSLRMEGFVQRRVYVDAADGDPVKVSIELPALKTP